LHGTANENISDTKEVEGEQKAANEMTRRTLRQRTSVQAGINKVTLHNGQIEWFRAKKGR